METKPRVLITARTFGKTAPEPLKRLVEAGLEIVELREGQGDDEARFRETLAEVDALLVGARPVAAEAIAGAKRLKVIAKHGVGYDNIDVAAATAQGIAVVFTPGANDSSVADLAIGLMLAVARQIPEADKSMKAGQWGRFTGRSLWGKRLAVIGLGRIGQGVCLRGKGFNMEVSGYDVKWPAEFAAAHGIAYRPWPEVLQDADFVSLHLPLLPQTTGLIGAKELALMKPGSILVNTARGKIVDEQALYEALAKGHLAGAGVDVWEHEPPTGNPLLTLPNVVATPHAGAHTYEAAEQMGAMCADGILAVLSGRRPKTLVNPEVFDRA
ncbi:MAG: phosphoglycerate dehydrogenase [Methanocella sp.]